MLDVEVAGLGPERHDLTVERMTALALVLVGHGIGEGERRAVPARHGNVYLRPGDLELGLSLLGVPDIGPGLPAGLLPDQHARLDQPHILVGRAQVRGEGEGLDQRRADRKLERLVRTVGRRLARRHVDEAVFLREVGKERRGEMIGDHAFRRRLLRAIGEEGEFGEAFGRLRGEDRVGGDGMGGR
jgi:hypothetical protein